MKNNIYKQILTTQEYSKINHKTPYVINLKNEDVELLFFGSSHINNINHPDALKIVDAYKEFNARHRDKMVVIIENFLPPELLNSETEMIEKFGESGLVYYLAKKNRVNIICPEPKNSDILKKASDVVGDKELVGSWAFINYLYQIIKKTNPISLDNREQIRSVLKNIGQDIDLKNNKAPEDIYKTFSEKINSSTKGPLPDELDYLFKTKVDLSEIKKLQDPFIEGSDINMAGAEVNRARDYFITKSILKELENKNNTFAVFGSNHAVSQEPVFNIFFKK